MNGEVPHGGERSVLVALSQSAGKDDKGIDQNLNTVKLAKKTSRDKRLREIVCNFIFRN